MVRAPFHFPCRVCASTSMFVYQAPCSGLLPSSLHHHQPPVASAQDGALHVRDNACGVRGRMRSGGTSWRCLLVQGMCHCVTRRAARVGVFQGDRGLRLPLARRGQPPPAGACTAAGAALHARVPHLHTCCIAAVWLVPLPLAHAPVTCMVLRPTCVCARRRRRRPDSVGNEYDESPTSPALGPRSPSLVPQSVTSPLASPMVHISLPESPSIAVDMFQGLDKVCTCSVWATSLFVWSYLR